MRDFFRGWRRKVGGVTLMMACGLTSLWLHCINGYVASRFVVNNRVYVLLSYRGQFECVTFEPDDDPVEWCFYGRRILASLKIDRDLYNLREQIRGSQGRTVLRLYYHWMVLTATAISAYLLLWKPRNQT